MFQFHNKELKNDCFYAAHKLKKPIKYTSSMQDNCSPFKILISQAFPYMATL